MREIRTEPQPVVFTRWRRCVPFRPSHKGPEIQWTPERVFGYLVIVPLERLSVIWPCATLYRTLQVTTCLLALPENAAPSKFPTRDSMRNPL